MIFPGVGVITAPNPHIKAAPLGGDRHALQSEILGSTTPVIDKGQTRASKKTLEHIQIPEMTFFS